MKWISRPLLAISLVVVGLPTAFFFEALASRELVLIGADPLIEHPPWREPGRRSANPELWDQAVGFLPYYSFLTDEVLDRGHLPGWNPYQFCGSPALGNPQFGHFDVFGLGIHALGTWLGRKAGLVGAGLTTFEIGAWLRFVIALGFTFALARRLALSRPAALLSALAFGFGGFQVLWLNTPLGHVSTFAPVILFFLDRGLRDRRSLSLAAAALALALAILAGHPETAFFLGSLGGAWTLAIGLRLRRAGQGWWALLAGLATLAAGTLMGTATLLPFLEYLGESGTQAMRAQRALHGGEGLGAHLLNHMGLLLGGLALIPIALFARRLRRSWQALLLGLCGAALLYCALAGAAEQLRILPQFLVDPGWLGDPRLGSYTGPGSFLEANKSYIGVLPLALALVGVFSARRPVFPGFAVVVGFACASLIGLLEVPPFARLLHALPPLSWTELSRLTAVGTLCLALLAGRGLDLSLAAGRQRGAGVFAWMLLGSLALLLALAPPRQSAARTALREPSAGASGEILSPWAWDGGADRSARQGVFDVRARIGGPAPREVAMELAPLGARGTALRRPMLCVRAPGDGVQERVYRAVVNAIEVRDGSYQVLVHVARGPGEEEEVLAGAIAHVRMQAGALGSRASWILLAGALWVGLVLLCSSRRPSRGVWLRVLALAALGLVAVDLWCFGHGFNTTAPKSWIYHQSPSLRFLESKLEQARRAERGEFRIWAATQVLPANCATGVRLRDVRGYDAIEIEHQQLFYSLWRDEPILRKGVPEPIVSLADLNVRNCPVEAPIFRALGVRFVLDQIELSAQEQERRGLRQVFPVRGARLPPSDGVYVYELAGADGMRAFLATRAVDGAQAAAMLGSGQPIPFLESPRSCILLDGEAGTIATLSPAATGGRLSFVADEPDRVELRVEELDGEAWLVLMDNDYPGWVARVDGREVPIRRAFTSFRAIRLPAAARRVEFRYEPASLRHAVAPTIAGLVVVALLVLASLRAALATGLRASARRRGRPCTPIQRP